MDKEQLQQSKRKTRHTKYYAEHKDAKARYYAEHREEIRNSRAIHRAEHREEIRKVHALYYTVHREERLKTQAKYHAEHGEERREYMAKYYAEHKEEFRKRDTLHQAKRRALKANSGGNGVKAKDIKLQIKNQKKRCWWCRGKLPDTGYHIDHRFALAMGGEHDPGNIVISCETCNLKKKTKTPIEFCGRLL